MMNSQALWLERFRNPGQTKLGYKCTVYKTNDQTWVKHCKVVFVYRGVCMLFFNWFNDVEPNMSKNSGWQLNLIGSFKRFLDCSHFPELHYDCLLISITHDGCKEYGFAFTGETELQHLSWFWDVHLHVRVNWTVFIHLPKWPCDHIVSVYMSWLLFKYFLWYFLSQNATSERFLCPKHHIHQLG